MVLSLYRIMQISVEEGSSNRPTAAESVISRNGCTSRREARTYRIVESQTLVQGTDVLDLVCREFETEKVEILLLPIVTVGLGDNEQASVQESVSQSLDWCNVGMAVCMRHLKRREGNYRCTAHRSSIWAGVLE